MSRMWLNNGRAVLTDGRAVLCDECPCGCRYTYYVDHSIVTSGNGLTWETAFNSVNDVFNSLTIRNYRIAGCSIYVKIRGVVNYTISGSYLYHSSEVGMVYLLPDSDARVGCNIAGKLIISPSSSTRLYVQFEEWDVTIINHVVLSNLSYISFVNCCFELNKKLKNGFGGNFFSSLYYATFNGCSIDVIFDSSDVSESAYVFGSEEILFYNISYSQIYGTEIDYSGDYFGNSTTYPVTNFIHCYAFVMPQNSSFENIFVNYGFSVSGLRYVQLFGVTLTGTSGNVLYNFTSSLNGLLVNYSPWTSNYFTTFCRFGSNYGGLEANTFFDCEQDCYYDGDLPDSFCPPNTGCLPLS